MGLHLGSTFLRFIVQRIFILDLLEMVLILDLGYLYNRKKRGLSVILKLLVVSSIIISIQALSINEVID